MQQNILKISRALLARFSEVSLQKTSFLASFAFSILSGVTSVAHAQSITPAADGTGTLVNIDGTTYTIEGGALSGDGQNLFHSFESFGLTQQEIANFLSNPEIRNILGRVSGGTPSQINGLLQVSGGVSNLYLMNPAGIVFGPNAQLNVPGSFAAVTANSVDFATGEFGAFGDVDYQALVGAPQGFSFATETSGAIVNTGDLAVAPGSDLILLGDTVVNTGTLTAPGGTITVAAIPETQQIRISQDGMVLGLAMNADALSQVPADQPIAASLPELVTGGDAEIASTIQVDEQGRVWLTGSQIMIPDEPGTVISSGEIDAASDMTPGGTVQVLGEQVALLDATVDASGTSGGDVFVGGDLQGGGDLPTAQYTVVDAGSVIRTDALTNGDGGQVIVWADDTTQFAGEISARGGNTTGDGGFVEVSGLENLNFAGSVNTGAQNGTAGTLLIDPEDISIAPGEMIGNEFDGEVLFDDAEPTVIFETQLESLTGNTNVIIQANNSITIEQLSDSTLNFQPGSGTITFETNGALAANSSIVTQGRDLSITAGSITFESNRLFDILTSGGSISLTTTNGDLNFGNIGTIASNSPGDVNISVNSGNSLTFRNIDAQALFGRPFLDPLDGTITINGVVQNEGNLSFAEFNSGTTSGDTSGTSAEGPLGIVNLGSTESDFGITIPGVGGLSGFRVTANNAQALNAFAQSEIAWNETFQDVRAWDRKWAAREAESAAAHTSWEAQNLIDDVDSLLD